MKLIRNILILVLSLCGFQMALAQSVLTGTVHDKSLGDPLIGANVYVSSSSNRSLAGAMVDVNGAFRLQVPAQKNLSIVFSFIGYKTVTVKYTGQKVLNMKLEEEGLLLDAVEVTAKRIDKNTMGQTPKEMVSATQKVTLENIESAPVTNITEALQGAMANVDILTGADPGSGSSIRIRGTSSLNASSEPLFVVDGVPLPVEISDDFSFTTANSEDYGQLLNISPSDIESIEVLKDAAATAVWGSKGANGVLLVTTKKGSKGRLAFTFSSKYEFKKEGNSIPMLNANQYVSLMQDAIWNSVNDMGEGSNANTLLDMLYNEPGIGYFPNDKDFKQYNQDTDWLKEVTQTGYTVDNNFSVSGGGDKADYRFSLGYLTEEGTTVGTANGRLNSTFNMRYKFSNKLDIGTNFQFTRGVVDAPYTDGTLGNKQKVRAQALTKMPNMSPYYIGESGERTSEYFTPQKSFQGDYVNDQIFNPIAMVNESSNRSTSITSRMIFNLHYKFFQGFDYYGVVGFDARTSKNKKFLPQSVTGESYVNKNVNLSSESGNDKLYLTTENRLIYSKSFTDAHKLLLSAIWQTSDQTTSSYSSSTNGNPSSSITDPIAGSNTQNASPGSGRVISREIGGVLNAHYTLLGKYMFDAGYRMEANSSLAANARWGGFPTFGIAWQLGDEKFIQKLGFVSLAKLRLSWGQSGNSPSGTSPYIGTFSAITNGYGDMAAIEPVKIQLKNLKYETVTQTNLGLDLYLFNNKLNFTIDLYDKITSDLLQKDVAIPSSTGLSKVAFYNSGKMSNRGWEVHVDYDVLRTKTWGLSFNFNVAQNRNEIKELPANKQDESYTFGNKKYAYKVVKGDPLGSFYGYKYLGVYQNESETYARDLNGNLINNINGSPVVMQNGTLTDSKVHPGDAKYQDMNGDGVIDKNDVVYLGNSNPTLTGGFGFNFRYKSFGLITSFHGRAGQKVINMARMNNEDMRGKNNQSTSVLNRWRHEGDNTEIPRALYGRGYNSLGSDRYVEDASFLRLKTVTLKYDLPKSYLKKSRITMLQLYITGYDLLTFTKYKGQDPEINLSTVEKLYMACIDNASTPKPLRFAVGLNLKF